MFIHICLEASEPQANVSQARPEKGRSRKGWQSLMTPFGLSTWREWISRFFLLLHHCHPQNINFDGSRDTALLQREILRNFHVYTAEALFF
jgi:hypothetical protein